MALFEGYERRIDKINGVLREYGLENIEQAKTVCEQHGINVDSIVKGIQPIAFLARQAHHHLFALPRNKMHILIK